MRRFALSLNWRDGIHDECLCVSLKDALLGPLLPFIEGCAKDLRSELMAPRVAQVPTLVLEANLLLQLLVEESLEEYFPLELVGVIHDPSNFLHGLTLRLF